MAKSKKKKKHRLLWLAVKLNLVFFILVGGVCWHFFLSDDVRDIREMREEARRIVRSSSEETFCDSQTSVIYAADGSEISTFKGDRESYYVESRDIPAVVIDAIVSIEDKKFFQHKGVDYKAMLRVVKTTLENHGKVTQGGSTITMQLARNVFITQERTWRRKAKEIFIAWELEKKYSKDDILEFYLNNIYFGNGYYGIQSASRGYFNRDVQDLDLSQAAFLCAIPNNPTYYDPVASMENTLKRRDLILSEMEEDGKISEMIRDRAIAEEIVLERPKEAERNDYVETYAYYCATRAIMEKDGFSFKNDFSSEEERASYEGAYGEAFEACERELLTGGYAVYTSLDLAKQEMLQEAVDGALAGYEAQNEEGVYELQASSACIDNDTGLVCAIVGGRKQDFEGYTLNRAFQSFRQPGSAIKPLIVYAPCLERDYNADSVVVDEPIEDGPKNANGTYLGAMPLRNAVIKSVNTIAWRLFDELTPEVGLSYLKEMEFSRIDEADYQPSSALGGFTNGVSAVEMASGFAALANDGVFRSPGCVTRIVDAAGSEVYSAPAEGREIYRQNAAREMTQILTGVLTEGTARGFALSNMPCAGKTGTTNEQKDGWFVGYTRYYTTSVWVGYDMPRTMDDLMGNTYPVEIWRSYMERVHEGLPWLDFLTGAQLSDQFVEESAEPEVTEGQEAVPQDAALPQDAAPQEGVPQEGVPQDAVPQDAALPQEGVPQEGMPQDAAPQDAEQQWQ